MPFVEGRYSDCGLPFDGCDTALSADLDAKYAYSIVVSGYGI